MLDSNGLKDGWRKEIYRENINSEFVWNNLTELDNNVSSWIPEGENSILEQLYCDDLYSDRRIGEKRKPWTNKNIGFNLKYGPIKFDGCES